MEKLLASKIGAIQLIETYYEIVKDINSSKVIESAASQMSSGSGGKANPTLHSVISKM